MIPGIIAQGGRLKKNLRPGLFVDTDTFYAHALRIATWWDAATASNVGLTGGNTIASSTSSASTVHGVRARLVDYKINPNGNFYFEVTVTNFTGGSKVGIGVGDARSLRVWPNDWDPAVGGGFGGSYAGMVYVANGHVFNSIDGYQGKSLGALATGDVIGVAYRGSPTVVYFKKVSGTPSGWNNPTTPGDDPVAGSGGAQLFTEKMIPIVTFGGSTPAAGNVFTANFTGPFVGAVPTGFVPLWPCNQVLAPPLVTDTDTFYTGHL